MVRIWCVPVSELNRQRLLGEHVELHTIFRVIVNNKKGYGRHPQTLRFKTSTGLSQLYDRHNQQVIEMTKRGYNHNSPLPRVILTEPYDYTLKEYLRDHEELMKRQGVVAK